MQPYIITVHIKSPSLLSIYNHQERLDSHVIVNQAYLKNLLVSSIHLSIEASYFVLKL
jgi:hypothetical protein